MNDSKIEAKLEAFKEKVEVEFKALEAKLKSVFHISNHDVIAKAVADAKSGVASASADITAPTTSQPIQSKTDEAVQDRVSGILNGSDASKNPPPLPSDKA